MTLKNVQYNLIQMILFFSLYTRSFGWNVSGLVHDLLLLFLFLYQMTPLHLAAESGHINKVKYLCDEGADINIQDNDGVNLNADRV